MCPFLAGNIGNDLSRFAVDHLRVCCASDIKKVRGGIDGNVIPSAFTTNMERLAESPFCLRSDAR
jgi:hypothetical protein